MLKRVIVLTLCTLLAQFFIAGCNNDDAVADNPVQAFIDESQELLEEVSAEHLASLGENAKVEFLAGDGEFIYVYSFGPGHDLEEIREFSNALLNYPSNITMYENLAGDLAVLMELDSLRVTVRYLDSDGNLLAEKSYDSQQPYFQSVVSY